MADDRHLREEGEIGLAGWIGQSRGMSAAHRHLDLEINYVLSGSMTYLVGGKVVDLPLNRLCLLWGGVPHQMMRSRQGVEAIWVTIPLTTILRWGLPEALIRPLLATGFLADCAPRPGDFDTLQQWLADLPGRDRRMAAGAATEAARRIVLLEIEARLRRFALGMTLSPVLDSAGPSAAAAPDHTAASTAHADRGIAAVEAMAHFMAANYQDEIGVAAIAEAAHLHPNYAMTLFRRCTGMTVSQYLVLQRVAHAQRLLATTSESIAAIAASSGFGSTSRFYEAFSRQTGSTPRRFRLQLESAASG